MGGVTNKRYPGILNSRIRLLSSWYHLLASLLLSRDTTGSHAVTCRFASQLQFISQALRWCREHNESRNKMFHWRPQWFLIQKFQKAIILEQKWEVPGLLMGGRFLGAHINQIHFSSLSFTMMTCRLSSPVACTALGFAVNLYCSKGSDTGRGRISCSMCWCNARCNGMPGGLLH